MNMMKKVLKFYKLSDILSFIAGIEWKLETSTTTGQCTDNIKIHFFLEGTGAGGRPIGITWTKTPSRSRRDLHTHIPAYWWFHRDHAPFRRAREALPYKSDGGARRTF